MRLEVLIPGEHIVSDQKRALLRSLKEIAALSRDLDPGIQLHGRIKTPGSTSEKMRRHRLRAHQILDVIGIRAVTQHTQDCYRLVRRIHGVFRVLGEEYDDYILQPKLNGYRSLHTTVVSPCGFPVEIQVRTHAMHAHAERGAAAHVLYKRASKNR